MIDFIYVVFLYFCLSAIFFLVKNGGNGGRYRGEVARVPCVLPPKSTPELLHLFWKMVKAYKAYTITHLNKWYNLQVLWKIFFRRDSLVWVNVTRGISENKKKIKWKFIIQFYSLQFLVRNTERTAVASDFRLSTVKPWT